MESAMPPVTPLPAMPAAPPRRQNRHLRGAGPALWDVFAEPGGMASATGFVLSHIAERPGTILWVQDRLSRLETGAPCLHGLRADLGITRPVLMVQASRPLDVLWALEEGLRCTGLACVIGEVWGDPKALDFTATKRLHLRAETNGVPVFLLRNAATANLSAARERWRIAPRPSAPHPDDARAPGDPRWHISLFKSRHQQPAEWEGQHDHKTHRLHLAAPPGDGTLAPGGQTRPAIAAG